MKSARRSKRLFDNGRFRCRMKIRNQYASTDVILLRQQRWPA
jgi:hypothetical protein